MEFRKAIESCLNNKCFESGESMYLFPRGCCGDCTELVGEYLINNNIEDLWYVCGTHYPKTKDEEANFQGIQSHAWISIGHPSNSESLIMDITGDQFKHNPEYNFLINLFMLEKLIVSINPLKLKIGTVIGFME